MKLGGLSVTPRKSKSGRCDRFAPERVAKGLDVGALDGADDPCQPCGGPREGALALGLRVEGVLEVLEGERVVEDRDIASRQCGPGCRDARARRPGEAARGGPQEAAAGGAGKTVDAPL